MTYAYDERLDGPLHDHDKAALVRDLQAPLLPDMPLLHEREDLRPFECDGLSAYRNMPMVVALPDTEDRCRRMLAFCHRLGRAGRRARRRHRAFRRRDAARGRRAAVARAPQPHSRARSARAPRASSRACATSRSPRPPRRIGLFYAPDPSSQIACTIGGNVAENSGGVHCLKYGLTVHNVLDVRG